MQITIDPDGGPVFEQIVTSVVDATRLGVLAPGDRIPPVRALADELGIAAGTVAKAYRRLEAEGAIETRGRAGSFVTARADDREAVARRTVEAWLATMAGLGLSADEAVALARDVARG